MENCFLPFSACRLVNHHKVDNDVVGEIVLRNFIYLNILNVLLFQWALLTRSEFPRGCCTRNENLFFHAFNCHSLELNAVYQTHYSGPKFFEKLHNPDLVARISLFCVGEHLFLSIVTVGTWNKAENTVALVGSRMNNWHKQLAEWLIRNRLSC